MTLPLMPKATAVWLVENTTLSFEQIAEFCGMHLLEKGIRYVSQSKRGDRPNAIAWIIKNHPEMADAQLVKLLRTTKSTITAIREKTYKNYNALQPQSPVTLGLCSESDLNKALAFSVKQVKKDEA